jgi:hypothetical protein
VETIAINGDSPVARQDCSNVTDDVMMGAARSTQHERQCVVVGFGKCMD